MNGHYTYRLNHPAADFRGNPFATRYTRVELEQMTTFQLTEICNKQRLVEGLANRLDRSALIDLIMRFRSADEHFLITRHQPGGFERIESVLSRFWKERRSESGSIRVPARLTLYKGVRTGRIDRYLIHSDEGWLNTSNVLLVNGLGQLCGILNLIKDEQHSGTFYLSRDEDTDLIETSNQNYSLLFVKKKDSDYFYNTYYSDRPLLPLNFHVSDVSVSELIIKETETTETVLAIDFGTSNTTAGAYLDNRYVSNPDTGYSSSIQLNKINYVAFPQRKGREWSEVLPTAVRVLDCSDLNHIVYAFGEEAIGDYEFGGTRASVLRGIKRWVNNYKINEELIDSEGNTAIVSRSDILGAFLRHVIRTAEQQFKCRFKNLHFTAPVKLQTQFLEMFAAILPDYNIITVDALDEGLAVLYNTLADHMDKGTFADGEEYQALVMDCGGGTTDLSSCRFRIEDGRIAYKLDIHTTFENGDTNFGGNNLTYRIMQFMKIVFAGYYATDGRSTDTDIDTLIGIPGGDVYRHVDEFGVDAVYDKLEKRYLEAGRILPTAFEEYENATREEYQRVLNNFHLLWGTAENMKKEFFHRTGVLRSKFEAEQGLTPDTDLNIKVMDRWLISVIDNGRFRDEHHLPDVVFNIREIHQLLKADIYNIVRKFLEEFYLNGKLQDYSIIKLTGQSCRIDLFREALKEFVPGKSIEFRQKAEDSQKTPELKMACLRGAIRYLNSKKMGMIDSRVTHQIPAIPYTVSALTHTGQERNLIASLNDQQTSGFISRPSQATEIEFFLTSDDGKRTHRYIYHNQPEAYEAQPYEEIHRIFGRHIPQDDTDSIRNGEAKYFVFAGDHRWGFMVVPVSRHDEQLYLGPKGFFPFETELSELDFFDGTK
ncbi:molecular chaperone [Paenibacillus sp. LS1]|uniref:molecular chaperone n=1 Tax=Paenibacillus sp. LS1 TaxID=2992120 RepID=UPI002230BC36|nr:molecular chaperone [Paenibacillus sp. LS1]MCW3791442.1 molecular chaperone [Paenibacillus sp. LS1]